MNSTIFTVDKIESNKLEEYKAWKSIGLRFYPYADFSKYYMNYDEEFLKELGLVYTNKIGVYNEFAELSAKVKYVITKQEEINEYKQNIVISKYTEDTSITFGADMSVQIIQNGEIINGTYTLNNNGEAECIWDDGYTDTFVKDSAKLYNKDSAINKNNKTFYLYEIQANGNKLDYENENYILTLYSYSIEITKDI